MHGIEVIADIAKTGLERIEARGALEAIVAIIDSLNAGWKGEIEVGAIRASIDKLRLRLHQHDLDADAALERKFPT